LTSGPTREETIRVLADSEMFSGLPEQDLDALHGIALPKRAAKGETIFVEGARATGFFAVVTGRVKLLKLSAAGKEQILHVHGPGGTFAEATLTEGATYPATAEAIEDTRYLLFPRADFQRLLGRRPALATNLIARLSQRLRQMASLVEDLALREAPGRLARYLLDLAGADPAPGEVVRLPIPKGELASLIGTRGETLSRVQRRLADAGVIGVRGAAVTLLRPDLLLEIADGENPGI
jgi:CRP/FNR family transcriptional regulator